MYKNFISCVLYTGISIFFLILHTFHCIFQVLSYVSHLYVIRLIHTEFYHLYISIGFALFAKNCWMYKTYMPCVLSSDYTIICNSPQLKWYLLRIVGYVRLLCHAYYTENNFHYISPYVSRYLAIIFGFIRLVFQALYTQKYYHLYFSICFTQVANNIWMYKSVMSCVLYTANIIIFNCQ